MSLYAVILAALAPGGVIVALIERSRKQNNADHARNAEILSSIDKKVDKIDKRLDDHIEWHLGGDDVRRSR